MKLFGLLTVLAVLVLLLVALSMVWPPDSPWAPWWRTSTKNARRQCELAGVREGDVVYDLGSGDGTMLAVAVTEFGALGVGIEIDISRYLFSRLLLRRSCGKRAKVIRGNFFDIDLSGATVVAMYLVPRTLDRLANKFRQELAPGTRLVTFVYQLDFPLVACDDGRRIYVYEVPSEFDEHPNVISAHRNEQVDS